jgi:hypothetical protein
MNRRRDDNALEGLAHQRAEMRALDRCRRRLVARLEELGARLDGGDDSAWPAYLATGTALAELRGNQAGDGAVPPSAPLLTTAELAAQNRRTPKTIRRLARRGIIVPAQRTGKRGDVLR